MIKNYVTGMIFLRTKSKNLSAENQINLKILKNNLKEYLLFASGYWFLFSH
jgi:hypothetical protein